MEDAPVIVREILDTKGRDVTTITPDKTLSEAAQLLAERKIGALVVTGAKRRVTGILSERDIVKAVSKDGATALLATVESVMTREVVMCGTSDTMAELMGQMTARRIRHMPVIENDRLAGIISIGDVVKHRLAEIERESSALRSYIMTA
jgi:CBS domain-containing protein